MKKLLALFVFAAMASTASALSFNWTVTGIKFGDETLKKSTDVVGYLIYLGAGGSYSTSYALSKDSTADTIASSIGQKVSTSTTATSNAGKLTTTYTFDYGDKTNGDVFGVLLSYTKEGKTYYNLSSSTYTLAGISDETSSLDTATISFSSFADKGEASSISSGSGWVQAVPEPSTAALALAGLALLLKRRKA